MKLILRALFPISIAVIAVAGCGDDNDDNGGTDGGDAGTSGDSGTDEEDSGAGGSAGMDSGASDSDAGLDSGVTDASVDASPDSGDAGGDAGDMGDGGDASEGDSGGSLCPGQDDSVDIDDNNVVDCTENLLINSQFTSNIVGWTEETSAAGEHVTLGSGALEVTSTVMSNSPSTAGVGQCVQVEPQSQYVIGGQFFTASDQGIGGLAAQVTVILYAGTDCDGAVVNEGGTTINPTTDAWTTVTTPVNTTSANSMFVAASVRKAASDGSPGVITFDNLLVRINP